MPFDDVVVQMKLWRKQGGKKLSLLGGEPTLHPDFSHICRCARDIGYERVVVNTNGLTASLKQFSTMDPHELSYVQVSLDGGSSATHDLIRGNGTFEHTWKTIRFLVEKGFDTRVICTVNRMNIVDCTDLIAQCDAAGVTLLKYHVFSDIGSGAQYADWVIPPAEWIQFYESLKTYATGKKVQVWYQPTYANERTMVHFYNEGYRGCVGRSLARISVFPDGRAYVCSFLFDTDKNMFFVDGDTIRPNSKESELALFSKAKLTCQDCSVCFACAGGCPAEDMFVKRAECGRHNGIFSVCRLWNHRI